MVERKSCILGLKYVITTVTEPALRNYTLATSRCVKWPDLDQYVEMKLVVGSYWYRGQTLNCGQADTPNQQHRVQE